MSSRKIFPLGSVVYPLGVFFGVVSSIFGYSYLGMPYGSKRLLAVSFLLGVISVIVYTFLFRHLFRKILSFPKNDLIKTVVLSFFLTPVLFFLSSIQWQRDVLFGYPLLPTYELEISVTLDDQNTDFSIIYFANSFGDVSYSEFDYRGWEVDGNILKLSDPVDNFLHWQGKIGEEKNIHFLSTGDGGLEIKSNLSPDFSESFSSGQIKHRLDGKMSWFSSRGGVLLLGNVLFFILVFAGILSVWHQRANAIEIFSNSLSDQKERAYSKEDFIWLALLVIFAVGLRIFNLDVLPPHLEEFQHLNAAKDILNGANWHDVYQRSFYTVTFPVYLSFKWFGVSLFAARLPGVLFNVLAIIPLYFTTRKINRPLAILASFLYTTSPLVIALARNVREYAYYPFYFYSVVFIMIVYLYELWNKNFSWNFFFTRRQSLLLFVLLLPPVYILYDKASTSITLVLGYMVFVFFVFIGVFRKANVSHAKSAVFFSASAIIVGYILDRYFSYYASYVSFTNYLIPFSQGEYDTALNYFFSNSSQQWYYNRLGLFPVIALLLAIGYGVFRKKKDILSFFTVLYLGSFFSFLFFFNFADGPRYYLHVQLWHIVVLAAGIYGCSVIFFSHVHAIEIRVFYIFFFVALIFNPVYILNTALWKIPGGILASMQRHDSFEEVHDYLLTNASQEDALISYDYGRYVKFYNDKLFPDVYAARSQDSNYVFGIMESNNSGWIVVSEYYYQFYESFLPLDDFSIGNVEALYMGEISGSHLSYIWHWDTIQ